jgi:hypothetical protein
MRAERTHDDGPDECRIAEPVHRPRTRAPGRALVAALAPERRA